jgi:hypothetical protein
MRSPSRRLRDPEAPARVFPPPPARKSHNPHQIAAFQMQLNWPLENSIRRSKNNLRYHYVYKM